MYRCKNSISTWVSFWVKICNCYYLFLFIIYYSFFICKIAFQPFSSYCLKSTRYPTAIRWCVNSYVKLNKPHSSVNMDYVVWTPPVYLVLLFVVKNYVKKEQGWKTCSKNVTTMKNTSVVEISQLFLSI